MVATALLAPLAHADWNLLMRDVVSGGSDTQVGSGAEAETIINLGAPNATYNFNDYSDVRAKIDVAGAGSFSGSDNLPNGSGSGDDYVLKATAFVEIPAGDWTIGFGRDDGGYLRIDPNNTDGFPGFTTEYSTNGDPTAGDNEVRYNGTGGHSWTWGTFTLAAPLTTTIEVVMFERGGGDSLEVGMASGLQSTFSTGTWNLLIDGQDGWTVSDTVLNDTDPPVLVATGSDPAPVIGTDIYAGANLQATFDETIQLYTGGGTPGTITVAEVGGDGSSDFVIDLSSLPDPDGTVTASGNLLIIDPAVDLEQGTDYEVTISSNVAEDDFSTPNVYGGTSSSEWTFTVAGGDATAPVIVPPTSPADDATGVTPDVDLVATFDEDIVINSGSGSVLLDEDFDSSDGGFTVKVAGQTGTTWEHGAPDSIGIVGNTVTDDADGGGQCWATDLGDSGIPEAGYYDDVTVTCLRSPVIDLTSAALAQLTFMEALDVHVGNGDTTVVRLIDDTTDAEIAVVHTSVDGDVNNSPWEAANGGSPIDLSAGLGQQVRIEWCLTGLAGGSNDYLGWYIDNVVVTATAPSDVISLKNLTDATETLIPVDDSSQVSVSGGTLTISPSIPLAGGRNYAVQIGSTAIRNYNDIDFAGIADDTTWNFATTDMTTYAGEAGNYNKDTWNDPANWSAGVPSGGLSAIIDTGEYASVSEGYSGVPCPAYTGDLTLNANSTLEIAADSTDTDMNALGGGTITMNTGSEIAFRRSADSTHSQDIVVAGDAEIDLCRSTNAHVRDRTFNGEISGPGRLSIYGESRNNGYFNGNNASWSGGLRAYNGNSMVFGGAANSLGTGDVTIDAGMSLGITAADAMGDAATLFLNGSPGSDNGSARTKLVMNADDTINQAFIDGNPLQPGTYGRVGTPASVDNEVSWISGDGVLTVSSVAADGTAPTVVITGPAALNPIYGTPTITYTLSFDEDIEPGTVDASDFGNAGTAPATIGTVTRTSVSPYPAVYTVEVVPSGAGTVDIEVTGVVEDFAGNALAVPVSGGPVYTLDTSAQPARDTIAIESYAEGQDVGGSGDKTLATGFDASAGDKLVVVIGGEHGFGGNTGGQFNSMTYSGETMTRVVHEEAGIPTAAIFYLDDPASFSPGNIVVNQGNHNGSIFGIYLLSGTAPGVGASDKSTSNAVNLLTSTPNARVIAGVLNSGPNGGNGGTNMSADLPLIEDTLSDLESGSRWVSMSYGSANLATPTQGFSFSGANASDLLATVAVEIPAAELVGGGSPEIAVEEDSTDIPNATGSVDFGTATIGTDNDMVFTILNTGDDDLHLIGSPLVDISGDADFTVTVQPATNPVPATTGTTSFTVRFTPAATGARSATISIASDDSDENPFTFSVTGTGQTAYAAWSGGLDFEVDTNGDGIGNGMAFLLGAADPDADATGLLPTVSESGGDLVLSFSMLNAANRGGASMATQHSADLGATDAWDAAGNEETVPETTGTVGVVDFDITPNGILNDVTVTIPASEANGGSKLFGRLLATE